MDHVNVLFIDYTAGTGFSYTWASLAENSENTEHISEDLLRFMTKFYKEHSEFKTVPLYIFGELFSSALTVEIANRLDQAIKSKRIDADFRGIGLGNPWISPVDLMWTTAPYLLLHVSL